MVSRSSRPGRRSRWSRVCHLTSWGLVLALGGGIALAPVALAQSTRNVGALGPVGQASSSAAPSPADTLAFEPLEKNGWAAIGEVILINTLLWSYNRYLRDSGENPGFRIGFNSWEENIKNGFEWDDNSFTTNQFAHPYHGSTYFNAARANGFDYWESVPFAFAGSWMWEYLMETHHPSINDWVATSVGGATLGETLWRFSDMILDNTATGSRRTWKEIGGFLVNPVRGFNRLVNGRAFEQFGNPPNRFPSNAGGFFRIGLRTIGENQVWQSDTTRVYMDLAYSHGNPFGRDNKKPFDSFAARLQLNFDDKSLIGQARVTGLLWSDEVSRTRLAHHRIGITQRYDYINQFAYEWGGQSVTGTLMSEIEPADGVRFYNMLQFGAMIMGATVSDYPSFTGRSYDYGIGPTLEYNGILVRGDGQRLFQLRHQQTLLETLNGNAGSHRVTITQATLEIPFRAWFGGGVEYMLYTSDAQYEDFPDVYRKNPEFRAFFDWQL